MVCRAKGLIGARARLRLMRERGELDCNSEHGAAIIELSDIELSDVDGRERGGRGMCKRWLEYSARRWITINGRG